MLAMPLKLDARLVNELQTFSSITIVCMLPYLMQIHDAPMLNDSTHPTAKEILLSQMASVEIPLRQRDICGKSFAEFIEYGRDVWLQDAAIKFMDYPEHVFFNGSDFMRDHWSAFHRWRMHLTNQMQMAEKFAYEALTMTIQTATTPQQALNNIAMIQHHEREYENTKNVWKAREERVEEYMKKRSDGTLMVSAAGPVLRVHNEIVLWCSPAVQQYE